MQQKEDVENRIQNDTFDSNKQGNNNKCCDLEVVQSNSKLEEEAFEAQMHGRRSLNEGSSHLDTSDVQVMHDGSRLTGIELSKKASSSQKSHHILAPLIIRSQAQLGYIKGSAKIYIAVPILLFLLFIIALYRRGMFGLWLPFCSVLPPIIIAFGLWKSKESHISNKLMCEMFVSGATVSVALSVLMEVIAFSHDKSALSCLRYLQPSFMCDLRTMLILIMYVGFSEEIGKLLPLCVLKTSQAELPFTCYRLFRLAESPYGFCLAGIASAAGFAAAENFSYITLIKDHREALVVSLLRGIMSIPIHISSTCFAAARVAHLRFNAANSLCEEGRNQLILDSEDGRLNVNRYNDGSRLWKYIAIISVPAILHGCYDAGLYISAQQRENNFESFLVMNIPIICYITSITLGVISWRSLAWVTCNESQMDAFNHFHELDSIQDNFTE